MSDKYFTFISKKIGSKKFVNLLKSIYEHSPWVPERLLSKEGIEIKDRVFLNKDGSYGGLASMRPNLLAVEGVYLLEK